MIDWKPKAWGRMRTIIRDSGVEIVEAEIEKGGYSSIHLHHCKNNSFIVVSGALKVTESSGGVTIGEYILKPFMQPHEVPCGVRHQFEAVEPTRLIEVYRPIEGYTISPDDIERFSEGGLRK